MANEAGAASRQRRWPRASARTTATSWPCARSTCSVAAGQLVALVGHNGSGKSTFLRLAAGLLDAHRRHDHDRRRAGRLVGGPGRASATCPTSRCSTTTCRCASTSRTWPPSTASTTGEDDSTSSLEPRRARRPGRRPAGPVQPRPAPEDLDRARPGPAVLAAARRRAVRRPRRPRQGGPARAARRAPRRRRRRRRRHPRPDLRRAGRPLRRAARRRGRPRRPRRSCGASSRSGLKLLRFGLEQPRWRSVLRTRVHPVRLRRAEHLPRARASSFPSPASGRCDVKSPAQRLAIPSLVRDSGEGVEHHRSYCSYGDP